MSRKVMKGTTEVSGNRTPEACFSLSGVSMRQTHASPIPTWYQVYVRLRGTTQSFLTVLCRFRHYVSTRKIYRQLQGYSKFGWYSLHLGIFFLSPQGHLGDMGQSNDLVSLFIGEVIVDVVDNSLTSLWHSMPLVVLVRKSARFSPVLMCISRVSPIATDSRSAW
jgi:hypothetical protein